MRTPWWTSYRSLSPRRIAIVSSTLGSPTYTGWKRRSRAASFSMYFWYSLSVVAPHAAQLAAREERLEHVRGVHGALGRARAHHGVQLVDEEDHLALGLLHLLEHGLQPVLELAAVFGSRDQRAQVEGHQALVLQRLGDVAGHDALGEAFHDGGLADAGLADQDGIVLGAAGEHLDHAAHLVVAADDGVELALPGEHGEVAAVALERLVALLGVGIGDPLVAADLAQDGEQRAPCSRRASSGCPRRRCGASSSPSSRCSVETYSSLSASASRSAFLSTASRRGESCVGAPWVLGRPPSALLHVLEDGGGRDAALGQGRGNDPALLRQQRPQQVLGRELRMIAFLGEGLRLGDGLLRLDGELVQSHRRPPSPNVGRRRAAVKDAGAVCPLRGRGGFAGAAQELEAVRGREAAAAPRRRTGAAARARGGRGGRGAWPGTRPPTCLVDRVAVLDDDAAQPHRARSRPPSPGRVTGAPPPAPSPGRASSPRRSR